MAASRLIKVFIASPSDLTTERRAFKNAIDALNTGFGRGAEVCFQPLGWEDALSTVGRRTQAVINDDIDSCDIFVLVMWRRWGQDAPDAEPFSSYTEEEFYRAYSRWEKHGTPSIFVFFKHIDPAQMADPGKQLRKVLAFRKRLEATRIVLYRSFANEEAFAQEVDEHLVAFAQKGQRNTGDPRADSVLVPESIKAKKRRDETQMRRAVTELKKLRAEAKRALTETKRIRKQVQDDAARAEAAKHVAEARAESLSLAVAESAAKAALAGRIEDARQGFAKALDGTVNLAVLNLGYEFYKRIGELDEAKSLMLRALAISGSDKPSVHTANAYNNLAIISSIRRDLRQAEAMHQSALVIDERILNREGMARDYNNLGKILRTRGNLDDAEAMFRKALVIEEALGPSERLANYYGNLGLLMQARGNVEEAESLHRKALAIEEGLGRLEGMARQYGNLGKFLLVRGELDSAEAMLRKALATDETLAEMKGFGPYYGGRHYSNLGRLFHARGDLQTAEIMIRKAIDIDKRIGRLEGLARNYRRLAKVLASHGDVAAAEAAYREAIAIGVRISGSDRLPEGHK